MQASLFVDNMIMYKKKLKESTNKSLELTSKFSKVHIIFPYDSNK